MIDLKLFEGYEKMKNKKLQILKLVQMQSNIFLQNYDLNNAPTTNFIAKKLDLDRSVASKNLNELFKNDKLIKINTRPVIYLNVNENLNESKEYRSIADFKNNFQNQAWQKIIGWNGSLKEIIEQLKAAVMYPPMGLPAILFGKSGTGKTFLIRTLFEFAKQQEILRQDAQLVVINCAQYANNPELLSSVLFGYTKGSFTGADSDTPGALQTANNGILFLDEVHRLSSEGQEKLFTYLDTGLFTPVGNNAKKIASKARLFFATTKKEQDFLETFLRRIPIKIKLPTLDERGAYEKRMLAYNLINQQAKRINCKIKISKQCISLIYHYHFRANVGELENLIQNIVARKFSQLASPKEVEIKIGDLPDNILQQMHPNNLPVISSNNEIIFQPSDSYKPSNYLSNKEYISKMQFSWEKLFQLQVKGEKDRNSYYKIVRKETHEILYSVYNTERSLINSYAVALTNIFSLAQVDFYNLENSTIYDLSIYIFYLMKNEFTADFTAQQHLTLMTQLFAPELQMVEKLAPLIEMHFEVNLRACDCLWLAILSSKDNLTSLPQIPAIVVAHGYATASSMADTCNHFLQAAIFTPVDLKPDVSKSEMITYLKNLIKKISPQDGLLILMDMGSLKSIMEPIQNECNCDLLVINNFSMAVMLEIGNQLLLKKDLPTIQKKLPQNIIQSKFYKQRSNFPPVIITTCMTGMGSAQRIKGILTQSFTGLVKVQVEAYDFKELVNYQESHLLENKNVIGIVGIDNPDVEDIPYFGLEEIMTGEKIKSLESVLRPYSSDADLKQWESQLIKNFSLDRILDSLTIISPNKVMNVINKYIKDIQHDLEQEFSYRIQISLYVHIANMIERIIRGNEIKLYNGDNKSILKDKYFSVLKKHNSVLENNFSIKISDPETAYIRDLLVRR